MRCRQVGELKRERERYVPFWVVVPGVAVPGADGWLASERLATPAAGGSLKRVSIWCRGGGGGKEADAGRDEGMGGMGEREGCGSLGETEWETAWRGRTRRRGWGKEWGGRGVVISLSSLPEDEGLGG